MLRPRRNNHQIPRLNILILAIDSRLAHSRRKRQSLVDRMYFIADIPAHWHGHEDHLAVQSCP